MRYIVFVSVFLILVLAGSASAATLYFDPQGLNGLGVGQEFELQLLVDSGEDTLNGIEASLTYPTDLLELVAITEAGSILQIWLPGQPDDSRAGEITFAGVSLSGFRGDAVNVLSFIFKTKGVGQGLVLANTGRITLADGLGTQLPSVISRPFVFETQDGVQFTNPSRVRDITPPDFLQPIVTSDPDIFDGQYFLIFSAYDQDSGIDYYEVKEGRGEYTLAQSPYLLSDQTLESDILIRVTDRAGNEKVVRASSKGQASKLYPVGILILALFVLLYIVWRKRRS